MTVVYHRKNVKNDMYFRLRGPNLPAGTANETDAGGNPLSDPLIGQNTPEKAYTDLWFYSNPFFNKVARCKRKQFSSGVTG